MLFGERFRRWFTTAEVSTLQELKSAILSQCSNNCHKRFLTDVSVNGGIVLKT